MLVVGRSCVRLYLRRHPITFQTQRPRSGRAQFVATGHTTVVGSGATMVGKLQLDPEFVAKMDRMLQSRAPKPASKPSGAPAVPIAKGKKKKTQQQQQQAAVPSFSADAAASYPPVPAPKPAASDLFVIDRSIMEELVNAYVEKHVKALPTTVASAGESCNDAKAEKKEGKDLTEGKAKFVVQRMSKTTGKLVQRTVDAANLRSTDHILHMVVS